MINSVKEIILKYVAHIYVLRNQNLNIFHVDMCLHNPILFSDLIIQHSFR